jgi:hypothetical protein
MDPVQAHLIASSRVHIAPPMKRSDALRHAEKSVLGQLRKVLTAIYGTSITLRLFGLCDD